MIKRLKIYNLCDNESSNKHFFNEHGLSFFIEADNKRILFDTGQSDIFLRNAEILHLNLDHIDNIVLSHSHYDHTGGLKYIYNKDVIIHKHFFKPKYKVKDHMYKYIGINYQKEIYEKENNLKFIEFNGTFDISNNITAIGNFKSEFKEDYFFIKQRKDYLKDSFKDEIILIIKTIYGLVIITGCAHSGIINIINKALKLTNDKIIFGLLGGFHLSKLSNEENEQIASLINSYNIENIGISHCTGCEITKYLNYGNIFKFNSGSVFKI